MLQIDTGMLAIFVTVLLSIISLSAWLGSLSQKVRSHDTTIEAHRRIAEKAREQIHIENRQDHQQIFTQLEEINTYIRNGKPK